MRAPLGRRIASVAMRLIPSDSNRISSADSARERKELSQRHARISVLSICPKARRSSGLRSSMD